MGAEQKKRNPYLSLAAVTLAFTFTFLSRYIWSPLMADVSNEFGINATQAGLYMSAFFAGYLVTQIPGGIMADRYQPKYILIACTVLGGVMTAAMSFITNYEMGLVIRVITGISSGCVMAQCSKVVATTFEPKKRASAMGVVLASPPFGITLAQSIGAPLNQAVGWRNTFLIVAAIVVIIVALLAVFVQPIPQKRLRSPPEIRLWRRRLPPKRRARPGCWKGWWDFSPTSSSFCWASAALCSCS